ncbi:S8 family serine peptidase [Aquimarina sp. D1M17]|uniref:S8 family serine peptidase n=1 Tax=Aquimarina acroporae TaxID=2937283 RepID=UPI0020BFE988|nr:S8 family serine peptidase [Aquimarina acroporae]MCK8523131.1 S8 family serine peptidase [Aquimarina acroporae]
MKKSYRSLSLALNFTQTKLSVIAFFTMLLVSAGLFAQTTADKAKMAQQTNLAKLNQLQADFSQKAALDKKKAVQMAQLDGRPTKIQAKNGSYSELQKVASFGGKNYYIYYTTNNVDAARSTRTNHLNSGGSLGLNLDGQNMTAHVWDGGHARVTHQEYDGPGGNNRVTIQDASSEGGTQLNFHAAHVTGTVMASGVQADAKGMAPQAKVHGYMWNNDVSEATSAAANGMLVSNHSYGFRGDLVPDQYFGAYIDESRNWDEVMFNAPFYLMVVAAGNDGNQNGYNGAPLDGNSSYDKLTGHSTSKNNLVVANAQDANVNSNGSLVSVSINSSSSEGPTDDYRIKPDITGNGTGVYSTYQNSDTAYNSITGTSMASPNVTGSLLLLQQHYNNINGNFMRAATLKGIALHTADDAGPSGPDAVYGWGLLNAKAAAEVITNAGSGESKVEELTLNGGQSYTITVDSDGTSPLLASISWTDRPGTAVTATNSNTPVLVNDLDIRVTKGSTTYEPYRLTSITTNGTGDNNVDPYERIDVANASGTYTITVTHKGSLTGGSQNFSLVVTGLTGTPVVCNATVPTNVAASNISHDSATIGWTAVPAATYDVRYRVAGNSSWTTLQDVGGNSTNLSGLTELTSYEVQVRSKCSDGTTSSYSPTTTFSTIEFQLTYCDSNGQSVADEFISRVQLGTIDNTSGAGSGGYTDFTSVSTSLAKGSSNTITVTPTWTGTTYNEGYSVWIDYNQNGVFTDAGEQVWTQSATQTTPVSGSFTVPSSAADGPTRMRVSMKYNGVPTSCESFQYGEVEDYTVSIGGTAPDTQAPTAPTSLAASNITETTLTLNWTASTDNVGVTEYDVYQGSTVLGSVTNTTANVTGLTANTAYQFSVVAKDAAGNESAASNVVSVTTSGGGSGSGCTSGITAFPYNEGFENTLGAWTQSTADDINWTVDANGTPSNGTGPSSATQGSYYIFVEASGNGTGYPNKQAILTSPCFDLSSLSSASLTFSYHMYGAADMGSIAVEASTDEGATWTSIWSQTGNKGNSWQNANIDLAAYVGGGVQLRFNRITGATWQADIAIDNLSIGSSGGGPVDQCEGVPAWSSTQSYSVGDRVTYQGSLYERTATGWTNLGPCGTTTSFAVTSDGFGPPIGADFILSPNPANSVLNVSMRTFGTHQYRILNMLGQVVDKGTFTNVINVQKLENGPYILNVDNGTIKRFIKQ